jgi:sporulation protein YlmC with PRC-barrel domain
MKALSLASVIALVLSVSAVYAASPSKNVDAGTQTQRAADNYDNGPATADTVREDREAAAQPKSQTTKDIQRGLNKADRKMRAAADDVKAFFVDDDGKPSAEAVIYAKSGTAKAMLGADVLDPNGKDIAKVKDIIIDADGNATHVIVSDGGVLGIGDKLAAFEYGKVAGMNDKGDVRMALTQDMIDNAKEFSYDKDDKDAKVIPAGSFSVDEILDGELRDERGSKVAGIDNLSIKNGKADSVIVKYHKKMSVKGEYAALSFASLEKTRNAMGSVDLRMNAAQSAHFDANKSTRK